VLCAFDEFYLSSFCNLGVCFFASLFYLRLFPLFSSFLCLRSQTQYPFVSDTVECLFFSFCSCTWPLQTTRSLCLDKLVCIRGPSILILVLARKDPLFFFRWPQTCIGLDVSRSKGSWILIIYRFCFRLHLLLYFSHPFFTSIPTFF
jgi:hypothetical protein